jgi:hypothetical protein
MSTGSIKNLEELLQTPGAKIVPIREVPLSLPGLPAKAQPIVSTLPQVVAYAARAVWLPELRVSGDLHTQVFVDARKRKIHVIYCAGSVCIDGDLDDDDYDFLPALIIQNNLEVRNWLHGGKAAFIGGDVIARGCIAGEYNDGVLFVAGALRADGGYFKRIRPYHDVPDVDPHQIAGRVDARVFDSQDPSVDRDWLEKHFVPEILTPVPNEDDEPEAIIDGRPGDWYYDSYALIERCKQGLPIWR